MSQLKVPARPFNLLDRTKLFAKEVRDFTRLIPKTVENMEDCKQLIRSSGSVGANYIEASEGLSRKDFLKHLRIARKEAKETTYWLQLLHLNSSGFENRRTFLAEEAKELLKILSSMIHKAENNS